MNIKTKGRVFIILGIVGGTFVFLFDIIAGKHRYYLGPKSIIALTICGLLIIQGIIDLLNKQTKS